MKIENINIGMEFKSYKALCEALGEPIKSGKSKTLQLKQWQEYFTWTNLGNKYIITDIKKLAPVVSNYISLIKDNSANFQDGDTLSMYDSIISQIPGNSLRDLIAKSIINNLYIELTELGQAGFKEAWWVTDAELYRVTGMISNSHYYAIRNPVRFCNKIPELTDDNLDEVLDHMNVNRGWLNKQRDRVLKYLSDDLHLITYYQNAYFFVMRTTRIRNQTAFTNEEYYYPTLDELEWINKDVIPKVMKLHDYTSLAKIKNDGKTKEFYQEWLPKYINENLPTGWGFVTGVYKCHRIGFSQDVIEYAVNNHMKLIADEKATLNMIAQCAVEGIRKNITDDRNTQSEKRHIQALNGTSRCDEETRLVRCRESYIGVGFVVNRECHSNVASYTDFTKYDRSKGQIIISKME